MLLFQDTVGNFGTGSKFVHNGELFVVVRPMREVWVRRQNRRKGRSPEVHGHLVVFVSRYDGQRAAVRPYRVSSHGLVADTLRKWAREQGVSRKRNLWYLHREGMARRMDGVEATFLFDREGRVIVQVERHLGLSISHNRAK